MSAITFNPSALPNLGLASSSELGALLKTDLKVGSVPQQLKNPARNINPVQNLTSNVLSTENNKVQLARKEAADNPWFPNSQSDANPRDYQAEERERLAEPAFKRIDNVLKNSAYGRAKSNSAIAGQALGSKRVIGDTKGATAAFSRDSSYYSPNRDGRGTITLSPAILLKNSSPEVAALALLHEGTHADQSAAFPKYPQDKAFPIQFEVEAFEQQLKLYKEFRWKLVDANGNPQKRLNEFDRNLVKDTELLYQLQKTGGAAAIQKEIESWPQYQNIPGRKDKIYLPGGVTIPKFDLPEIKIPAGALPHL